MASALESNVVRLRTILGSEFSASDIESHKYKDVIKTHDRTVNRFSSLCVIDTRDRKQLKGLVDGIKDIARAAEHSSAAASNCVFIFNSVEKCQKCCIYYMHRCAEIGLNHKCADIHINLGNNWIEDCAYLDFSIWKKPRGSHVISECACKDKSLDEFRSMMMFILEQGEKESRDNPGAMAGVPERLYEIMAECRNISIPIMKRMTDMASRISSQLATKPVSADCSAPKECPSEETVIRCIFSDILSAKIAGGSSSNVYKAVKVLREFNTIDGYIPPEVRASNWDSVLSKAEQSPELADGVNRLFRCLSNKTIQVIFKGLPVSIIHRLVSIVAYNTCRPIAFNSMCVCRVCVASILLEGSMFRLLPIANMLGSENAYTAMATIVCSSIACAHKKYFTDFLESKKIPGNGRFLPMKMSCDSDGKKFRTLKSEDVDLLIKSTFEIIDKRKAENIKTYAETECTDSGIYTDAFRVCVAINDGVTDYGQILSVVDKLPLIEKKYMYALLLLVGIKNIIPRDEAAASSLFREVQAMKKAELRLDALGNVYNDGNNTRYICHIPYTLNDLCVKVAMDLTQSDRLLLMSVGMLPSKLEGWEGVADNTPENLVDVGPLQLSGVCSYCEKEVQKVSRCKNCMCVCYCSVECQRSDWEINNHRSNCKEYIRLVQEIRAFGEIE